MEWSNAAREDIPECGELYQQAFPDAIKSIFSKPRIAPSLIEDILVILHDFEPNGFIIARENTNIIGLIIVVGDLNKFTWYLIKKWIPIRIIFKWVFGRYKDITFQVIKRFWKGWRTYRHADCDTNKGPAAQVVSIIVKKGFQGKGFGTELMERGIQYLAMTSCGYIGLEVDVANEKAIHIYDKLGFREQSRFVSPRGDAMVMIKSMKSSNP